MADKVRELDAAPTRPRTSYKEIREAETKMFARKLWRRMVDKGWNQSELARRSGLGRDMISGYVRAKHLPDPPRAKQLADALGVEIEDLFPSASPLEPVSHTRRPLPPVELTATSDGRAMLHLNLEMPMEVALQVLALVQRPSA